MPAFDSSFDSSFDSGGTVVAIGTVAVVCPLAISVVDLQVFEAAHHLRWSPVAAIDGVDVSARLTGRISINAAEDSARVASLSLIPVSAAALASYDNVPITIDVALYLGPTATTYRLFTGTIESREFSAAERVATLMARDGYQERPKSCTTAAEVEALFTGQAYPAPVLLEWSDSEPDPVSYFAGLLDTLPGAVAIDASGLWHVIPWTIPATPDASFGAGDIYNGSLTVTTANRAELPASISATLVHRIHRLHAAELDISWARVERTRYVVDGLPTLPKSTVQAALDGIADWHIKGVPRMTQPAVGSYPVIVGGSTVYYIVSHEQAQITCDALAVSLYRRWYQQVDLRYSIDFAMGGLSDRIESVSATLTSDFDAGAWESPSARDSSTALYAANAPIPAVTPTGYEALPEPHPPTNGAIDYIGSHTSAQRLAALLHVVAKGLRQAASGKRKQRVSFARPIDPRFEIGAALAVSAYGVVATGQVIDLAHDLDLDSGDASSRFTLAVPDGNGTVTGASVAMTVSSPSVVHAFADQVLGNPVGSAIETPAVPVEDALVGFLCNVAPTSANYSASKPAYNTQFRLILPAIPAASRDPLTINRPVTGSYTIAGSGLTIAF